MSMSIPAPGEHRACLSDDVHDQFRFKPLRSELYRDSLRGHQSHFARYVALRTCAYTSQQSSQQLSLNILAVGGFDDQIRRPGPNTTYLGDATETNIAMPSHQPLFFSHTTAPFPGAESSNVWAPAVYSDLEERSGGYGSWRYSPQDAYYPNIIPSTALGPSSDYACAYTAASLGYSYAHDEPQWDNLCPEARPIEGYGNIPAKYAEQLECAPTTGTDGGAHFHTEETDIDVIEAGLPQSTLHHV